MKIHKRSLNINFDRQDVGIYLVQMNNILEKSKGYTENNDNKDRIIDIYINRIIENRMKESVKFFIFPEVTIPFRKFAQIKDNIIYNFPKNSVSILGLEIIDINKCNALLECFSDNEISRKDRNEFSRLFTTVESDKQPVNLCVIAIKSQRGKTTFFIQPKIAPSKYEGNLDKIKDLLHGDYIYHFVSNNFGFLTLICSDFFLKETSYCYKIIDEINYRIIFKNISPLNFIFNIQYNPSPDDPVFIHSLNKIYDNDDDGNHHSICTISANSIISSGNKGGQSKIYFSNNTHIQEREPIKQIDAHVVGYEFKNNVNLIYISFDRLQNSIRTHDVIPVKTTLFKYDETNSEEPFVHIAIDDEETTHNSANYIQYIAPLERITTLDFETYEEIAEGLSDCGYFEESIKWANRALSAAEKKKNIPKLCEMNQFIAKQYRHMGKYAKSLNYYLKSNTMLTDDDATSSKDLIELKYRVDAGLLQVQHFLIDGDLNFTLNKWNDLILNATNYMIDSDDLTFDDKETIDIYILNAKRQLAEIYRLLGNTGESLEIFNYANTNYPNWCIIEKAYAQLGCADSYRMQKKYDIAINIYNEVEQAAKRKRDKRLLARVLRNKSELFRISLNYKSLESCLNELYLISDRIGYLHGKIYHFLIKGGFSLSKSNYKDAHDYFSEAQQLSDQRGQKLKIEYAHSMFGFAEVYRFNKDFEQAAQNYQKAYQLYEQTSLHWGINNTKKAINALHNGDIKMFFVNIP